MSHISVRHKIMSKNCGQTTHFRTPKKQTKATIVLPVDKGPLSRTYFVDCFSPPLATTNSGREKLCRLVAVVTKYDQKR